MFSNLGQNWGKSVAYKLPYIYFLTYVPYPWKVYTVPSKRDHKKKDENYQLINICPLHCQKVFHSFSSAVLLSSFYCALTALLLPITHFLSVFHLKSEAKLKKLILFIIPQLKMFMQSKFSSYRTAYYLLITDYNIYLLKRLKTDFFS